MSIFAVEIPSVFGAVNSTVAADGLPVSAQALREIARGGHRIIAQGEPLAQLVWDSSTDALDGVIPGALSGYGVAGVWQKIYWGPMIVDKRPGLRTATAKVVAKITSAEAIYMQIATRGAPFNRTADIERVGNLITMVGSGSFTAYTKTGIPVDRGPMEGLDIYVQGASTTTLIDTGTYGSPSSGTVDAIAQDTLLHHAATWDTVPAGGSTTGTLADGSAFLSFEDASGNYLVSPRRVIGVISATQLRFTPSISGDDAQMLQGSTFKLRKFSEWRIASISLYTEDLTG